METANSPALLLLGLPPAALAGIDLLSFTVTRRFQGVKHLPAGYHFAFAGTSAAFSERHGLWFRIATPQESTQLPLFVAKWDAAAETLVVETDEAQTLRWRGELGSVWREGLTPYRQSSASAAHGGAGEGAVDWLALTSHVNACLLSRITGGDASRWRVTSASSARRDIEDIRGLDEHDLQALQAGRELSFLPIDLKQTWRDGATGRERSEAAQDRSWALAQLVERHCADKDANELIGEMQFCFLMVLTINNFSCLEQWKRVISLIFTCQSAVRAKSGFFVAAIATLRLQLQHCNDAEGGLIDLADEGGSLLKALLTRFRRGLEGSTGAGAHDVLDELSDLEDYLHRHHGWRFGGDFARSGLLQLEDGEQVQMETTAYDEDDETGEFAPQIVHLTPEQARLLGVAAHDT